MASPRQVSWGAAVVFAGGGLWDWDLDAVAAFEGAGGGGAGGYVVVAVVLDTVVLHHVGFAGFDVVGGDAGSRSAVVGESGHTESGGGGWVCGGYG